MLMANVATVKQIENTVTNDMAANVVRAGKINAGNIKIAFF